jgi:diaminohydroxyphosphoribosylaminopyrimidine deaminase/5-amino-6-(5-phosphoribosylamino)uracil reductase
MPPAVSDEPFMKRALELAERGRYSTSPNPMVGCVIVRDGVIIGEGFHERAGEPHAEINAIRAAHEDVAGATMYVTLEPCAHHGRTPPCVSTIIAKNIARVVIAMRDPNEVVDGRSLARLEESRVDVTIGVCEAEARRLNEAFFWSVTQHRPFVILKAAMTLDGKLATVARESRWITSEVARERSLDLREQFDAIMVGAGTVLADNPSLTRRLGKNRAVTPWTRVVVDASGKLSPHTQLFSDGGRTILFTTSAPEGLSKNVEVITMNALDGRLDLESVLRELHAREIRSLLVEGGSLLHSDFIRRGLWQKMIVFVAPIVVGGAEAPSIFAGQVMRLTDAHRFRFDRAEFVGTDLMLVAYP